MTDPKKYREETERQRKEPVTAKVLKRLGTALGWRASPSPQSPPVSKKRATQRAPKAVASDNLQQKLEMLLAGKSKIQAGAMNFIGLTELEQKLGDQWPKMSGRVDVITRKVIERRLTNFDVYFPFGTLNYLIVFAQLSEDAARLKCAAIAREIETVLLGDGSSQHVLRVQTAVKQIDGQLALVELETVEDLVARVFRGIEAAPRQNPAVGAAPASGETPFGPKIQLVYRPVLDVRKDAVSTFILHQESAISGDKDNLSLASLEELDRTILDRAVNDLRAVTVTGRRFLLIIPVHFETLARKRAAYIQQCQMLPNMQQKLIIFELLGMPDGIPQSRLLEITGIVKPFARAILMRVRLTRMSFFQASDTGLFGVGCHIGLRNGNEAQTVAAMERFAEAANKAGLRAYAHALPSRSLVSSAIGAGFDYIDSDMIGPAMAEPGELRRFSIHNH